MADDCAICYDALNKEPTSITTCEHTFHERCLAEWLRRRPFTPNCPLCRKPFKVNSEDESDASRANSMLRHGAPSDIRRAVVTADIQLSSDMQRARDAMDEVHQLVGDLNRALDLTTRPLDGVSPSRRTSHENPLLRAETGISPHRPLISAHQVSLAPRATSGSMNAYRHYLTNLGARGSGINAASRRGAAPIGWVRSQEEAMHGGTVVPGQQVGRYLSR